MHEFHFVYYIFFIFILIAESKYVFDTLKYTAAKVNLNLLINNTPLCTTNESQKPIWLNIRDIQNYICSNKQFLFKNVENLTFFMSQDE